MRINIYQDPLSNGNGGPVSQGFTATGRVYLLGDPLMAKEASTKQYADNKFAAVTLADITFGQFLPNIFPEFSGDVTIEPNSTTVTLNTVNSNVGLYGKVTVDNKGRVVSATALTPNDIPSISWSKIVSNKPTTSSGYGIVDAMELTGGTMTGNFTLGTVPVQPTHGVTKIYVDNLANSQQSQAMATGDVVLRTSALSLDGFLRCNGAVVSKTTYSDLYAIIGDTFNNTVVHGAGKPWEIQNTINANVNNSALTTFTSNANLPVNIQNAAVMVTHNRVYIIGGGINTANVASTNVYSATVDENGNLSTWDLSADTLPVAVGKHQVVVTKNRAYSIGGVNSSGQAVTTVMMCDINSDGTLGAWVTTTALPVATHSHRAFVTSSKLYVIGGTNSSDFPVATVYYSNINEAGYIGSWQTGVTVSEPVSDFSLVVTKNKVHAVGGKTNGGVTTANIYSSTIDTYGALGSWTLTGILPTGVNNASTFITKDKVYVIGGRLDSGSITTNIMSAGVNADGTLGGWNNEPVAFPIATFSSVVFATKNKLNLVSGSDGTSGLNISYTCVIDGGLNSYTTYYSSVNFYVVGATEFKLPDHSHFSSIGMTSFIKY